MSYASDLGYKLLSRPIFEGGVKKSTISGDQTLSELSESFLIYENNKGSGAIITLSSEKDGQYQWITCHADSGHQLEIRNVATATITYLTVGQAGLFVCDGSNWHLVLKA